jgi:ABC-type transporter MlaC component
MTKFGRLFIVLLSLTFLSISKGTETPENLIKDIFERAGKENLMLNQSSKEIVDSRVDFGEMSLNILAEQAKKQNPEEIKWFKNTIQEIITLSVYPSAPKFLENVKITFKPATILSEEQTKIASVVSKKGDATQVDYVLKKYGDDWKIIDVAIDEESWVKTINEKVQSTITKKGWNGLKKLLNKRLNDLKNPKKV